MSLKPKSALVVSVVVMGVVLQEVAVVAHLPLRLWDNWDKCA